MPTFFEHNELMKAPPIKRAAYSDRTAWIMAELSRLVYERLPSEQELDEMLGKIMTAIEKNESKPKLLSLVAEAAGNVGKPQESVTDKVLKQQNFELFKSHAVGGTEVMIVKIPPNKEANFTGMFVVVFRGTQPTSFADLKADLKANLVSAEGGGRIHSGFWEAFLRVRDLLEADIHEAGELPVYITGHSLGGALALVATRYLGSDSVGATYTFGGPRVGDDDFFKKIKTPVYRVVNSADGVARIPFGAIMVFVLGLIRLIPINGTKAISEFIRRHIVGYTHYGNLVMLTNPGPNKEVNIMTSPSIFKTALLVAPRLLATRGKAAFSDHSMSAYSTKLGDYALRRQ